MLLVERDGSALAFPVDHVDGKTLKGQVAVHVAKDAIVMTDKFTSYHGLNKHVARHETVNHSIGQYARVTKDGLSINTNTAKSFFALLKRGHYGTFHQLSKQHLHRYCNECSATTILSLERQLEFPSKYQRCRGPFCGA